LVPKISKTIKNRAYLNRYLSKHKLRADSFGSQLFFDCIGNFFEIPYTAKTLREDATGAQMKFASLRLRAPARKESQSDSLFSVLLKIQKNSKKIKKVVDRCIRG
jgi:hypothetical protein